MVERADSNSIQVSDAAKGALDQIVGECGLPRKLIVERLLVWAAAQTDVVRGAVLKTIPSSVAPDVARLTLERLAGEPVGIVVTAAQKEWAKQVVLRARDILATPKAVLPPPRPKIGR